MSPAEAEVREALETAGAFQWPSVTSTALTALLSELDALRANAGDGPYYKQLYDEAETECAELRARCEAGDALLIEASNRLEELGKGGHICDAIDAHLKGAGRE